ncbi:hypothetical protein HanPI659440_Chr02g0038631 [Helianthus annuus]|nr:hypothetical protein HanPI659440_Chr02g0038631 [Helianthus annuus]
MSIGCFQLQNYLKFKKIVNCIKLDIVRLLTVYGLSRVVMKKEKISPFTLILSIRFGSASIPGWIRINGIRKKDVLSISHVDDFRISPIKMKMAGVKDMLLIMRKLGSVEPDNYWYSVCEGEAESVIQRPWHLICKCRRKMKIVSTIAAKTEGPSHIHRCWITRCF